MLVIGGVGGKTSAAGTGTGLGTCGEIIQGFSSSGEPFHVTLPIEKTSTVSVTLHRAKEHSVTQVDPLQQKLEQALLATALYLDLEPCEMRVAHWTDLEVGKGMGSSTADVVAAARALGNASGHELKPAELASIAVGIESSDGSMYPGIVVFNHRKGLLYRLDWYPQFIVVMVTPPKRFNTESAQFEGKLELGASFDQLLASLNKASKNRDVVGFAETATQSAKLNQRYVPNPYFEILEEKYRSLGAVGLNVGHTGTVTGILFDASDPKGMRNASAAAVEVQGLFPSVNVEMTMTPAWQSG